MRLEDGLRQLTVHSLLQTLVGKGRILVHEHPVWWFLVGSADDEIAGLASGSNHGDQFHPHHKFERHQLEAAQLHCGDKAVSISLTGETHWIHYFLASVVNFCAKVKCMEGTREGPQFVSRAPERATKTGVTRHTKVRQCQLMQHTLEHS